VVNADTTFCFDGNRKIKAAIINPEIKMIFNEKLRRNYALYDIYAQEIEIL
jgi:hypothetical protein